MMNDGSTVLSNETLILRFNKASSDSVEREGCFPDLPSPKNRNLSMN